MNKHRLEHEDRIDVLSIDNTAVRAQQVARIEKMKETRDSHKVSTGGGGGRRGWGSEGGGEGEG